MGLSTPAEWSVAFITAAVAAVGTGALVKGASLEYRAPLIALTVLFSALSLWFGWMAIYQTPPAQRFVKARLALLSGRGALGPIYLAGHLLDKVAVNDRDLTTEKLSETVTLARGATREALAYQGAGYPMVGVKHRLALHFEHLSDQLDLVEELFAAPGPYDVVVWKRTHPVYAGDGARATFLLPWYVRDHFDPELPVPGTLRRPMAQGKLAVEVRIGLAESGAGVLTALHKSAEDYAADKPKAGEAWFLKGGLEFKVGRVPLAGERLYVRYVPILPMFEEVARSKPPLDRALVEA